MRNVTRNLADAQRLATQIFDDYQMSHHPGEVMQMEPMFESAIAMFSGERFDPLVGLFLTIEACERLNLLKTSELKELLQ